MNFLIKHFENLSDRLCEVKAFIDNIELQKKLFSEYNKLEYKLENDLPSLRNLIDSNKHLFNSTVQYNAVIISIYACFENYIDDIAKELINFYFQNTPDFNDLPRSLKSNYFSNLGEFLSKPQQFPSIDKKPEELLDIIYKNIFNERDVSLQHELLIKHSGNLKFNKVIELFNNIDVKSLESKIKNNHKFKKYISDKYDIPFKDVSKHLGSMKNIFSTLDDIVEARNNIAHGWNEDSRISYQIIISEIIPFISCLCNTLMEEIMVSMFEYALQRKKIMSFDEPIDVFNNNILCINSKQSKLRINDYLFCKCSNSSYVAKIISLQKNGTDIVFNCDENINIGIGLDRTIKTTYQFYYMNI